MSITEEQITELETFVDNKSDLDGRCVAGVKIASGPCPECGAKSSEVCWRANAKVWAALPALLAERRGLRSALEQIRAIQIPAVCYVGYATEVTGLLARCHGIADQALSPEAGQ